MQGTVQSYVLDMAASENKIPMHVKQSDTNSRQARITLKAFGEPWTIPFASQIHIVVAKSDGTQAMEQCVRVDENTVLAPISEQMTAIPGTQRAELYFVGSDGDIKSQTFPIVVHPAVMDRDRVESSDDFNALRDALQDVKTSTVNADRATQESVAQTALTEQATDRANTAAESLQQSIDSAAAAKVSETNAKTSETAAAQTQQEVTDYVERQKAAFVGYSKRESDSKYANAIIKTATGEGGVTVEDAWTAPVLGLDVVGKSEQVVTTGAQLFDASRLLTASEGGATVTNNGDGSFTVSGSGTLTSTYYKAYVLTHDESVRLFPAGVYTITRSPAYPYCYVRALQGGSTAASMYSNGSENMTVTEEMVTSPDYAIIVTFRGSVGNLIISGIIKPMINAGSTALPFEPYTGGAPSPSPDYPQDIISTGTVSTGAQLFYRSLVTFQGTGAEADVTDQRAVKITCTRANGGKYAGFIVDDKSNIIGKTLTISYGSIVSSKSGLTPCIRLYWIDNNGSISSYVVQVNTTPTTITIENPQNDAATKLALLLYVDINSTAAINDYVIYKDIMINAGSTALPWEPYTGGKPAPSVEYPQTLEVETEANLFYKFAVSFDNGGIVTDASDKRNIKITCTNPGKRNYAGFVVGDKENIVGKSLTIVHNGTELSKGALNPDIRFLWIDDSSTILSPASPTALASPTTLTITAPENNAATKLALLLYIGGEVAANDYIIYKNITINIGPNSSSWRPKSATITLTEPLRGIGDYRDRIMCRDGVWGIERWFAKIIFDGSADEDWGYVRAWNNAAYFITAPNGFDTLGYSTIANMLCGTLKVLTPNSLTSTVGKDGIAMGGKGFSIVYIYIAIPAYIERENEAALRTYLSANPLTVLYPLATPTWTPLPDATQQALNALTTYAGTTHLTITAGGTTPTVTLDYVQDTHKAFEQCKEAAKEYTDNQIAAIVAALPTATQAAIADNQTTRLLQEV